MPALVKSSVGSLAGKSGLERTRVWPCRSKYSRNFSRISLPVIKTEVRDQRPEGSKNEGNSTNKSMTIESLACAVDGVSRVSLRNILFRSHKTEVRDQRPEGSKNEGNSTNKSMTIESLACTVDGISRV